MSSDATVRRRRLRANVDQRRARLYGFLAFTGELSRIQRVRQTQEARDSRRQTRRGRTRHRPTGSTQGRNHDRVECHFDVRAQGRATNGSDRRYVVYLFRRSAFV